MNIKSLRFVSFLLTALILSSALFASSVSAEDYEENFIHEIGDLDVPYGTPVIDGTITPGEGWSDGTHFDRTTIDGCWGGEDPRLSGYLYRAWDDKGLYIAADLYIPDMILSTDLDVPESDGSIFHGFDGEVFILTFDPDKQMQKVGMGDEFGPWYCIGIFEGNEMRVYRSHINEKEITTEVNVAGAVTDKGWRLEICIPWDLMFEDIKTASLDDVQLKKQDIVKGGTECNMHFIYLDRWYDIEMRGIETYSRYASICTTLPDGTPGVLSSATTIKTYGIFLHMLPGPSDANTGADDTQNTETTAETTSSAPSQSGVPSGNVSGNTSGNSAQGSSSGTTSGSNTSSGAKTSSSGEAAVASSQDETQTVGAAKTGDAGVIAAAAAALIAAAGLIIIKRKTEE